MVAQELEDAHLTLHTSRCESFGLSIAESMLMGNIPIVFETGIVKELIINGENGFIVKNIEEVCRIIDKANQDRQLLVTMSQNARKTVLEKMAPEIIGEKYLELIKEIR